MIFKLPNYPILPPAPLLRSKHVFFLTLLNLWYRHRILFFVELIISHERLGPCFVKNVPFLMNAW